MKRPNILTICSICVVSGLIFLSGACEKRDTVPYSPSSQPIYRAFNPNRKITAARIAGDIAWGIVTPTDCYTQLSSSNGYTYQVTAEATYGGTSSARPAFDISADEIISIDAVYNSQVIPIASHKFHWRAYPSGPTGRLYPNDNASVVFTMRSLPFSPPVPGAVYMDMKAPDVIYGDCDTDEARYFTH